MSSDIQQTPFIKELAANDRRTRDAALSSLRTYLSGRRALSSLDLLKIWKGLFYCMWMSDRVMTQQALADALAQLVFAVPATHTLDFLSAFWQTMQREWTNIDVLRMEKFLLLTRRYVAASFAVLEKARWDQVLMDRMLSLLTEGPCSVADIRVPNGLRYHVIDVYVDELERLGALDASDTPLETLLGPLRCLAKDSPTKTVRLKSIEALRDERLCRPETQVKAGRTAVDDDEWGGCED